VFRLDGKTALISGGAQGIGRGIGEVLADAGAVVYFCDLDEATGRQTEAELRERSAGVTFVRADVSRPEQMKVFVATAREQTGRIDIVCNNASYTTGPQTALVDSTDQEWDQNIAIGLMGARFLTAAAIPHMISGGGGSIIVVSSIQAVTGCPSSAAYTTVKAAQLGFVRSIAADYGPHNIRANAICPGPIRVRYSPEPGSAGHEWQKAQTMLGRTGVPRDIGYAALYLASDEGAFVTGAILPVDGGWTAK
jgi:3-oxoacyl-[acyl-carrier protein] reductase